MGQHLHNLSSLGSKDSRAVNLYLWVKNPLVLGERGSNGPFTGVAHHIFTLKFLTVAKFHCNENNFMVGRSCTKGSQLWGVEKQCWELHWMALWWCLDPSSIKTCCPQNTNCGHQPLHSSCGHLAPKGYLAPFLLPCNSISFQRGQGQFGGGLTCFSCSTLPSNENALIFILITEGSVCFIRQSKATRKKCGRIQLVNICSSGTPGYSKSLCDLLQSTGKSSHFISCQLLKYTNQYIHPFWPTYLFPWILY